jgi:hypothetical protein
MSLSLALLREDLRIHLGMDETDLPDVETDRLLNRSWWPMAATLRFAERDATTTFDTVASTSAYDIPVEVDSVQKVIAKKEGETSFYSLIKITDWNMFELKDTEDEDRPKYYSRRGSDFILYPTPDAVYNIEVKFLQTLDDIQSSGLDVPQEWHEVVLWGAISRGFFVRGDWNRGKEAQNQQAIYLQSLDTQDAKEHEDSIYSGLRPIRRRYP